MGTNVYATQDVYTAASSRGTNFEGNDLLVYGSGSRMYSYIDFDLSAFAGKEITEAVLKLHIELNNLASDTNIRFYRIDQSWDAGEVTYSDPPHVTSTNSKRKTIEDTDDGWEQWNVTDIVEDIISNGGYGIRVEIDANKLVEFNSIEEGHKPKLVITEAVVPLANGFTIHVATGLATKTLFVAHVVKLPNYGLPGVPSGPDIYYYPEILGYVGGEWFMADPATTYQIEVGSIDETIPAFDKKYGFGSFADGIDCVVMALGSSGVGTLLFKEDDVFRLNKDSPTEIYLSSTSNDIISDAFMGPVCDLFGIARGDDCRLFWAEMYDPMFIANYTCIMNTGKDLLGDQRELTWFDHVAFPFALIGVMAPSLPFGRFVSEGLRGIWKGGEKFSSIAFTWMKGVAIAAPGEKIVTAGPWTFMESIVRIDCDHLDEIMELVHAGSFQSAKSKLEQYLISDLGGVPYRDFKDFNAALRKHLPEDEWRELMGTVKGLAPQADSVIKTASKSQV